ncbi:hypothetical protein BD769DRAFT_1354451, partial [Suillus cothurnatus]
LRTAVDSFEAKGPHGIHKCLIYEPMRQFMWLLQCRLIILIDIRPMNTHVFFVWLRLF